MNRSGSQMLYVRLLYIVVEFKLFLDHVFFFPLDHSSQKCVYIVL